MKEIKMPCNEETFYRESDKAVEIALDAYKKNLIGDEIV